jgi:hypothetical protein
MASGQAASAANPAAQEVGRTPQTTVGLPGGGPFIRYAPTPAIQGAGSTLISGVAYGARPVIQLSAVGGFLKGIRLRVQASGGTRTAGTQPADAPFAAIQSIAIKDASGQPIYQPLDGYSLFLINLYSGQCGSGGSQDPRILPDWAAWASFGNTYTFFLYLPLAVNSSGYCSLPSDNSAELPKLEILVAPEASVVTGAVGGVASTLQLTIEEDFYAVPNNYPNLEPFDVGASAQWFITTSAQNPPSGAYMRVLDQAVGQFIHTKIYVFRDGNNVRQDIFPPSDLSLWIDNYPYRFEFNLDRYVEMAKAFGVGNTVFQPRPTGVIAHSWRQSVRMEVDDSDDLERLLVTTGATKVEIGGTWGTFTGVGQLTALTGMVFPGPSGWPYGSQSAQAAVA